jgi:hypothetical protein
MAWFSFNQFVNSPSQRQCELLPSNLYRGPSIDASYQVLVHLAKWRRFKKIGHSETRIACGGHDMYV